MAAKALPVRSKLQKSSADCAAIVMKEQPETS
jgi:hypothetical protein